MKTEKTWIQSVSARIFLAIVVAALFTQQSRAELLVNVTGVVGSGQTNWNWSGSYGITQGHTTAELYSINGDAFKWTAVNHFNHTPNVSGQQLSGELAADGNYNNAELAAAGNGTVIGSVSGAHSIDGVFVDSDGTNGGDDFSWFAAGTFTQIETLTFSGTSTISADITTFGEGATAIVNEGDTFTVSSNNGITNLSMTFTAIAAVPEPTSTTLVALALGAFGFRRSRNARMQRHKRQA
ncbi:MAG: PEP-CTERM sorting domain-containing protein [Planctomycetota bacterium]